MTVRNLARAQVHKVLLQANCEITRSKLPRLKKRTETFRSERYVNVAILVFPKQKLTLIELIELI